MNDFTMESNLMPLLASAAEYLAESVRCHKGVRIGESTVASKKMHTFTPAKPEEVVVIKSSDAGQAFYQRKEPGEVFHLDVFHQCGLVDHRKVAAAVKKAVEKYNYQYSIWRLSTLPNSITLVKTDLIDVQTATGGGRITGSLNFGCKLSLRRAHENHVHIAALIPPEHVSCLFYIVMAVEKAILVQELELRRNERIVSLAGDGAPADMSPYSDHSDSFLKDTSGKGKLQQDARHLQNMEDVNDLTDLFDTVRDMREYMDKVEQQAEKGRGFFRRSPALDQDALDRLRGLGIVTQEGKELALTEYGKQFKTFLEIHEPEIEAQIRKTFRFLSPVVPRPGRSKLNLRAAGGTRGRRLPADEDYNGSRQELAVAETVSAAARRTAAANDSELTISGTDIRQYIRHKRSSAAVCLVVDASASMIGQRLKAAKHLARHLLLATPDWVSIIVFQGEYAKVQLPFTRDYNRAEASLSQINAMGSTPLALGLRTCSQYLQQSGRRNPSIILITDGIPTIGDQSRDPMADSLEAAREIKAQGYGFTCFGLKPYRQYLTQLAEAAGGKVCVLDELEKRKLVEYAGRHAGQSK